MPNGDLKREKQWKKRLAREYGVEQPPESFYAAVDKAFDSLPDELPVKRRPLQTALRTCAALAACAVLLACGAFAVNFANPLFMESLPGVGQLFQQLNGTVNVPTETDPLPSPSPDDLDASSLPTEEQRPAFQEVSMSSLGEMPATLTVTDAWSDGIYLHLSLDLAVESCSWTDVSLYSPCTNFDPSTNTATVTVDGHTATLLSSCSLQQTSSTESGLVHYRGEWVWELQKTYQQAASLAVTLDVPFLQGEVSYTDGVNPWQDNPGFSSTFPVYADPSQNFLWESTGQDTVEDNEVVLQSVESTPTRVQASVEVPFFGRTNYNLITTSEDSFLTNNSAPLGVFCQATLPNGTRLQENYAGVDNEAVVTEMLDPTSQGPYTLELSYDMPESGASQVILTFYEYSPDTAVDGELIQSNRVTAEFTIDLARRQVYPSQNYAAAGLEKLDRTTSLYEDRTPTPVNGYICAQPLYYYDHLDVTLYTAEYTEYRPLAVYCYSGDTLVRIAYSYPASSYNAREAEGGLSYYEDENGTYEENTFFSIPYVQKNFKRLRFTTNSGMNFTRLALVDVETGTELIPDIERAYWRQADQVYGTHTEETLYGTSQGEGSSSENAGFPASEVTPTPQP